MAGVIYWEDLSAPQFRALEGPVVAVLPLGATEQHGPHLAVSVDSDLVTAVLARVEVPEGLTVLVLPALRITKSEEHNSHPGNTALLEMAVRDMRIAEGMIAVHCGWFAFAEWDGLFDPEDLAVDIHAGDAETSPMLAAAPQKVDMGKAQDFRPAMADWPERWIGLTGQAARPGWIIDDLNADGACGNAAAATAEKGAALLGSAARNFAGFLAEFARFDPRAGADAG